VVIDPDVDDAPATVAQLSRLAREGFFRGLTFHRVVPDFVVQGGDPRGDGEGGPGFTLPCEVSPRAYLRGTVGMALAGKDTGGSQLFVTLSPQPHLDGRYTIIGTVVSGMEALDGMVEGESTIRLGCFHSLIDPRVPHEFSETLAPFWLPRRTARA
jgi:cyclophilin family peptidyl-prolyl cis-trans isomerase